MSFISNLINDIPSFVMEDFVPFELAKKLNEKGFNAEFKYSLGYYDTLGNFMSAADHWFLDSWIIAPTISQVLKWLRKKKNIFVVTFIADDSDAPLTYEIYLGTECLLTHHGDYFTLQEWDKCSLVGIEYVLNNLI